jgi:hypothetical protein
MSTRPSRLRSTRATLVAERSKLRSRAIGVALEKGGVAAGVGPQLALAGLGEDVLHAVAGEVGEARGFVERDGGRGDVGPGGGEVGAEALAVAPGAGGRVEEVGEGVAVNVDPGAAGVLPGSEWLRIWL